MNVNRLREMVPDWHLEWVEETSSTSDLARQAGERGMESGWVIFADAQTAGRGQRGNRWLAPKGRDLMFSILLRPNLPLPLWPRLTTLAALAVCKAIEQCFPLQPKIKWPNDIYVGQRKVCGLLAETFTGGRGAFLVMGLGINVNTSEFPDEIASVATSLRRELPNVVCDLDREALAACVLSELTEAMTLWDEGFAEALMHVRGRSLLLGKNIRASITNGAVHGRALDLDPEGHLVLQLADSTQLTLSSAAEIRLLAAP